jgi:transposase
MPLNGTTIYIAIELSTSSWVVATRLPGVAKSKMHRIYAGDTAALLALISDLRTRNSNAPGNTVGLVCCFEAGRDGFWLHRLLTQHGVPAYVVEPTSVLVNRRAGGPRLIGWTPRGCCAC